MKFEIGSVGVHTTVDRGHSPEYHATRFTERMIKVGENVPEPLKAQALAFQDSIKKLAFDVIKRSIMSDRTTLIAALKREGMGEAAKLIETTDI